MHFGDIEMFFAQNIIAEKGIKGIVLYDKSFLSTSIIGIDFLKHKMIAQL